MTILNRDISEAASMMRDKAQIIKDNAIKKDILYELSSDVINLSKWLMNALGEIERLENYLQKNEESRR